MSYVPLRKGHPDNPDLVGLPDDAYDRLVPLGDLIEASHNEGYHQSECNCRETNCNTRKHHWATPSVEEVLGWLIAKGALTFDAVDHLVRVGKGWSVDKAPGDLGADVANVARLVLTERHSGTSFVQRKLRLGFKRAEDCLDVLTAWNILGPAQGTLARAIHVPADQTAAVLAAIEAVRA
ncbi:hypothetical protein BBK82_03625 [Lentzea guizhouensis]|uniref:FtsK gamma domain-containing protein n=1 Tax=Lentzea guizhouensis TaxID=1586287 RepID=A0A1B2HCA2_9PSEU|nr:DNA translocase FtsK [Lentzea guizhouensis]ANZ35306.1 hypothetical protein BBK82_03625 [Lentzea guizhouensis]